MKQIVVIGAGLAGLECAVALARQGHQVIVLEQDAQAGGLLQSFRRGDALFDVGMHYVGSLSEGEYLQQRFAELGLGDLPWQRLDSDCYDEVIIGDKRFKYPQGKEAFLAAMEEYFPHEKEGLRDYVESVASPQLVRSSSVARAYIEETISDPLLRQVLVGTALKTELTDHLPLFAYARLQGAFLQSAYRLKGGGRVLIDRLVSVLHSYGGQLRTKAAVTDVIVEDGAVRGVMVNHEEQIAADIVIAAIHPALLMQMLPQGAVRPVYRSRMLKMENSYGMFTANIRLKKGQIPYQNRNIYVHCPDADPWNIKSGEVEHILIHFYPDQEALDIMTPMRWEDVELAGDNYAEIKSRMQEGCLALAEKALPNLRSAIEQVYTSTPRTYTRYLHTPQGSAYGMRKDVRLPDNGFLSARTPVKGLFQSGHNIGLHGLVGTTKTADMTLNEIDKYIQTL